MNRPNIDKNTLDRLPMWQKFALIGVIAATAVTLLSALVVRQAWQTMTAVRSEAAGVALAGDGVAEDKRKSVQAQGEQALAAAGKSLASDQSTRQHTTLVGEAGLTMQKIVEQVRRVSQLIDEISHASGEQTAGIGQVSEAVAQFDRVTQQNAALVEESAAAADSLAQQAHELVGAVGYFRVGSALALTRH